MRKYASTTEEPVRRKSRTAINRTLVGIRIEPRLAKVMKGVAELQDCPLGELIERVFWHAIEGENAFAKDGKVSPEMKQRIRALKQAYGVNYSLQDLENKKAKPDLFEE